MSARLKLKHASGWAMLGLWFLFGVSCGSSQDREAGLRTALELVNAICPPEMTVGDCVWRVQKFVEAAQRATAAPADAGGD